MKPADCFLHCPKCGQAAAQPGSAPFHCATCGFLFYFNPAIAAGAVLLAPDDTVLLIRRARDPHKGKLTVLVLIFDRDTPVELDFTQVRKK